jgi:hypothetical protein
LVDLLPIADPAGRRAPPMPDETQTPGPVQLFCSRSAPEIAELARQLRALAPAVVARERTPSGMRLRFAASNHTRSSLEQFVRAEQQCCPFFEMQVTDSASGLHFQMEGPPEAQWLLDICHQLIDPAAASPSTQP